MITDIKVVLYEQKKVLTEMLEILETQFLAIVKKDVQTLNNIISDIENKSKELATVEIKRRSICEDKELFVKQIEKSNDDYLKQTYKEAKLLLENVKAQYEGNEMLLRKELMFTKKMINFMRPNESKPMTYNSYGQMRNK
ncbi:MAG: flagellar protein FlgN [Paraclostridium sp.]